MLRIVVRVRERLEIYSQNLEFKKTAEGGEKPRALLTPGTRDHEMPGEVGQVKVEEKGDADKV